MLLRDFIAVRLRELRAAHDLTQEQVAAILGTDVKWYQRIEWAKKDLRASTVDRLAEIYGISAVELLMPELPKTKRPRVPSAPHRMAKGKAEKDKKK